MEALTAKEIDGGGLSTSLPLADRPLQSCRYCAPDDVESISHDAVLRCEEMMVVCQVPLTLGIDRFKITGGEPLFAGAVLPILGRACAALTASAR